MLRDSARNLTVRPAFQVTYGLSCSTAPGVSDDEYTQAYSPLILLDSQTTTMSPFGATSIATGPLASRALVAGGSLAGPNVPRSSALPKPYGVSCEVTPA